MIGRSRCNEGVEGDGGSFNDGWRDNKELAGVLGEPGTLVSGDWRWPLLVLCRVGEMRASVLEEEEPGCDGRGWDDVCRAGDDIEACRSDGVI